MSVGSCGVLDVSRRKATVEPSGLTTGAPHSAPGVVEQRRVLAARGVDGDEDGPAGAAGVGDRPRDDRRTAVGVDVDLRLVQPAARCRREVAPVDGGGEVAGQEALVAGAEAGARVATTRASPDGGSSHRAAGASSAGGATVGPGRREVNSTLPSGTKTGPASPSALQVSRRAGSAPLGSTTHTALTQRVRSGSSVATVVISRVPSGLSASPDARGTSR